MWVWHPRENIIWLPSTLTIFSNFIAKKLLPEEACHLLRAASSACLLVSSQQQPEGSEIARHWLSAIQDPPPVIVPIEILSRPLIPALHVGVGKDMELDPASPGALFSTSGTTGPPKGVVQSRQLWHQEPDPSLVDQVCLSFQSPHWSSVARHLVELVQARVKILTAEWNLPALWERLRLGDVTILKAPPPFYAAMMKYFQQHIDGLPTEKRSQHVNGLRRLRQPMVSGGVSWPTVMRFWHNLLEQPLRNVYACTETGRVMAVMAGSCATIEVSLRNTYLQSFSMQGQCLFRVVKTEKLTCHVASAVYWATASGS